MIDTLDEYKKQMGNIIRAPTHIRCELELVTDDDISGITFTQSGGETFATNLSLGHKVDYITLEENWFRVDGSQVIAPTDSADLLPNGLVSTVNGMTIVEIQLLNQISLRGLSLHFKDPDIQNTVVMIDIWSQNHSIYSDTLFVKGDWLIIDKEYTSEVYRILIYITNVPRKRTRLIDIVFGEVMLINPDKVILAKQDIQFNYLSTELFSNELLLRVYDDEKIYHPDNVNGKWSLLKPQEKLNIYYGIQDIEFLRNTLYLTDVKRLTENVLQIRGVSKLSTLTRDWIEGEFNTFTLSELAQEIANDVKVGLILDLDFDKTTDIPMPILPVNQCFQLIANALNARLYCDKDDNIVITNKPPQTENVKISFGEMFEKPELNIKAQLKDVRVSVYQVSSFGAEIQFYDSGWQTCTGRYEIDIPLGGIALTTYEIATSGGSTVYVSDESYFKANIVHFVLKGEGGFRLQVKKRPASLQQSSVTIPVNSEGETCVIDNPLINDVDWAIEVGEHIASFYKKNKIYDISVREDYSIEAGDVITFNNDLEEDLPGLITRLQFNTPGQTGAMEVRRWD